MENTKMPDGYILLSCCEREIAKIIASTLFVALIFTGIICESISIAAASVIEKIDNVETIATTDAAMVTEASVEDLNDASASLASSKTQIELNFEDQETEIAVSELDSELEISSIEEQTEVKEEEKEEQAEPEFTTVETTAQAMTDMVRPATLQEYTINGVIEGEAGASTTLYENVCLYYEMVPVQLRTDFEEAGWHIEVAASSIGPRYGYSSIMGLTIPGEKKIVIDCREKCAAAIRHEMGHFLDLAVNFEYSNSSEFVEIWNSEMWNFASSHSTHQNNYNTSIEYFAESFSVYLANPGLLYNCCPDTYNYFESLNLK